MKKTVLAVMLSALALTAQASTYFVVVPVRGKTTSADAITVSLSGGGLPALTVGQPVSHDFTPNLLVAGDKAYTGQGAVWAASGLPAGLALNASTGVVSGTPSTAGAATVTLTAAYKGHSAQQSFLAQVTQPPSLVQFQGYRAWADGTIAQSCNAYRYPSGTHQYTGATGDGVYRIAPSGQPVDAYCDMTSDGGGWTLVMNAQQGVQVSSWYAATGALNQSSLSNLSMTSKMADADIQALTSTALRLRSDKYAIVRYVKPTCRYAHQAIPTVANGCGATYATLAWTGAKNTDYTGTVARGISDVVVADDTEYFQVNDTRAYGWFAGNNTAHSYASGSGYGGGTGFKMWAK